MWLGAASVAIAMILAAALFLYMTSYDSADDARMQGRHIGYNSAATVLSDIRQIP